LWLCCRSSIRRRRYDGVDAVRTLNVSRATSYSMSSAERAASVTFYSQPPCAPSFPKKIMGGALYCFCRRACVENVSDGTVQRTTVDGELNSYDDIQCASVAAAAAAHAVVVRSILHPPVCLSVCVCVWLSGHIGLRRQKLGYLTPRADEPSTGTSAGSLA